jgi:hypothetical protein
MRTRFAGILALASMAVVLAGQPVQALAPTNAELKRELEEKDREIREFKARLERLERRLDAAPATAEKPAAEKPAPAVADKPAAEKEGKQIFKLFGTLDTEVRWRDNRNIGRRQDGSSSNLHVRRAVVGAEVTPADFVAGKLVLQSEYIGTGRTDQDGSASATPQVDEATITLERDGIPVYGVVGKRVQPFGAFYNHLISEPMTQDAYEVKQAGATLGTKLPFWGLDLSATVYQGETQIAKLFEANLFDTGVVTRTTSLGLRAERDELRSFNVTVAATPLEPLALGVGYLSEPGGSRRNQTGAFWGALSLGDSILEAEYMHALARERFWNTSTEALLPSSEERTLAIGLAHKPHPDLTLAGRYERFWDDGLGSKAGIWRAQDRFSVGGSYTLLKRDGFTVQSLLEYRGTDIERPRGSTAISWRNELFGRLSISYE